MSPEEDDDASLVATIETDEDGEPRLDITVGTDEKTVEELSADVKVAVQNNQYVSQFERSALTLLALWERQEAQSAEEQALETTDADVVETGEV